MPPLVVLTLCTGMAVGWGAVRERDPERPHAVKVQPRWVAPQSLRRILISVAMLIDHLPDKVCAPSHRRGRMH
jgi:hypothetical protein